MKNFKDYLKEQHSMIAHKDDHKEITHGEYFSLKIHKDHHENISNLEHDSRHEFKCMDGKEWCAVRKGDNLHFVQHPDDVRIHANFNVSLPHTHFTGETEHKDEKKPTFQGMFANGEPFVQEHIEKVAGGYEVESEHGNKNLGKTTSLKAAKKRLRQIEYFKHLKR